MFTRYAKDVQDYQTLSLVVMVAILIASVVMFIKLVRRHTTGAERFGKWEWAVNNRFRTGALGSVTIDALDEIRNHHLHAREHYVSRDKLTSIYKLQSIGADNVVQTWHVLVRFVESYSTPIALRPVSASGSLVDLMQLQLFPKLSSQTRFAVCGLRAIDARQLATGPARALLPADIGLIRNADALILDFTQRPFDPVEFSRVYAVAEQIAGVLEGVRQTRPAVA